MRIDPWPKPRRDQLLRQLRTQPSDRNYQLDFQGQVQSLDRHRADIRMPCYRLSNGRTRAAQREWIALNSAPADYFDDPDSEPALRAQDEILRAMARDAGLLEILRTRQQDQPLILDHDGYVVNGNRRLCVMRMLLEQDEAGYARFRDVDVVILPPCSDDDIRDLEGRLQVQREGKADYTWVSLAMMCRERRAAGWSEQRIHELYDMRRSQLRELVQMLDDAEEYLAERGLEGRYSTVSGMEWAFRQLTKARAKCRGDEAKKVVLTQLAYALMDSRQDLGDRLYSQIPDLLENLPAITAELRAEIRAPQGAPDSAEGLDLLGGAGGSEYSDLIAPLRDPDNRPTVLAVVRDTLEESRSLQQGRQTAGFCANCVRSALTALQNAINAWDERTDTSGMPESLAGIDQAVGDIRGRLAQP